MIVVVLQIRRIIIMIQEMPCLVLVRWVLLVKVEGTIIIEDPINITITITTLVQGEEDAMVEGILITEEEEEATTIPRVVAVAEETIDHFMVQRLID